MAKRKWDGFGGHHKTQKGYICDCCGEKRGRVYSVKICEECWIAVVDRKRY